MECKTYNFKPQRHGDTRFKKRFRIEQATFNWGLVLKIKGSKRSDNVALKRINEKTWEYEETKENLPAGTYNYILCYTIGDIERTLLTGKMEVLNHL